MTYADIVIAALAVIFGFCALFALWAIVSIPLGIIVGRAINNGSHVLREQAADFGEPSRFDIENAYGPLVMYGPSGEAYDGAVDLPRRGGLA